MDMATFRHHFHRGIGVAAVGLFMVACGLGGTAAGFTPDSPEVRKLIDSGKKFLEKTNSDRVGGNCLIGLAFFKDGAGEDHPKVAAALESCQRVSDSQPEHINLDIYSTGIAIIFMCEVNPSKYRVEIERLLKSLELRQKELGGWGYPAGNHALTGDTSMTQYAVLSIWTAHRTGVVDIPLDSVERVCNWLIRTQDPSGAWGYQGQDPGLGKYTRQPQGNVRESLTAAGLGSTFICADLLGFVDPIEPQEETGLPPGLKLVVKEDKKKAKVLTAKVEGRRLTKAIQDGNGWFVRNYKIDPPQWPYYYMYAFERYQSFRELAAGRFEKEPKWYNDGVKFLTESQLEDGSWNDRHVAADTAFAILFLLRSTKKSIEKTVHEMGDGTLLGGRGLPTDVRKLQVRRGRIVGEPKHDDTTDLLAILEDPDHPDFDYVVEFPGDFQLSSQPELRTRQLGRLRRLLRAESYQSRAVAARLLGRSRELDYVPDLIFALSDPDWRVVKEARDGLRFASRRFDGFGLPDRPSDDRKLRAIADWKSWYLSVRPGAEFVN
jgi:hypothetical protein